MYTRSRGFHDLRLLGLGLLLLLFLLLLLGWRTLWNTASSISNDRGCYSGASSLGLALCLLGLALACLALSTLSLVASQSSSCGTRRSGIGSGSLLLLLLALLLRLCVYRLDLEDDTVLVDVDLVVQLQAEDRRVLDKVDMADNVVVALLAGPLLCAPLGDDRRKLLV